jgi:hypothetical protein
MSYHEKLKLGSFCHIDDVSWQRRNMEEGYPSLVFEGLHGLIGLKTMSKELKAIG